MKKYIKSNEYDFTANMQQDDIRYIVRPYGSKSSRLDAKDNRRGYTIRKGAYGGVQFKTLKDAKNACLQYMITHNIDSDFPSDYFDFYKIIYDNDGIHYTEEKI